MKKLTPQQSAQVAFLANQYKALTGNYDTAFARAWREVNSGTAPKQSVEVGNSRGANFANERAVKSRNAAAARKPVARAEFHSLVQATMTKRGYDYTMAYNHCLQARPDLANEVQCPILSPQMLALLHLNPDSTQEEGRAAWLANGKTLNPVDPLKIFTGLSDFYQTSAGGGISAGQAANHIKNFHPRLDAANTALS